MTTFSEFSIPNTMLNALIGMGFETPTPIQSEVYSPVLSGSDIVGIAQTGTGKTFAYLVPSLKDLKYSEQIQPRILIIVPTRELVLQGVKDVENLTKYMNVRVIGVYGGTNINTQKQAVAKGADVIVATPGRLYDLALNGALRLNAIKKLVIDEVDIMLDLGFRYQLSNIFELLPARRQNLMFSATMTEEVDVLIDDYFKSPIKISIALSGTPLEKIAQTCYPVKNFYTKVNLLSHLLSNKKEYSKVLVFVASKKMADMVFEILEVAYGAGVCVIHSNKSQNYRIKSIREFDEGKRRVIVATDVMARGLDMDKISHVINFDTPSYPENYMHRIGRTGRAEQEGNTILFYTENERASKEAIEKLMSYAIPELPFPEEVEISLELTPEERPKIAGKAIDRKTSLEPRGAAFHEKKLKNTKVNQGGSYLRSMKKYKKPKTKGDKIFNRKNKNK